MEKSAEGSQRNYGDAGSRGSILVQDMMTLVPGTLSLVGGLVSFYWYFQMDSSKKVFRHRLYFYLTIGDTLRGLVHFIYPFFTLAAVARKEHNSIYFKTVPSAACDVFGFFLVASFLSSNFVIAVTALHSLLIVFRPRQSSILYKVRKNNVNWRSRVFGPPRDKESLTEFEKSLIVNHSGYFETPLYIYKQESGLYRYDIFISVGLVFLLPVVLTSLSYVGGHRMLPVVSFCFTPNSPVWIRVVTAWAPRLLVLLFILCCYFSIYIYVYSGLHKVTVQHNQLLKLRQSDNQAPMETPTGFKRFITMLEDIVMGIYYSIFNMGVSGEGSFMESTESTLTEDPFHYDNTNAANQERNNDLSNELVRGKTQRDLANEIFARSLQEFKHRKHESLRALKSVFVYPASYFIVWIVPLIAQIYRSKGHHVPLSLLCVTAFFQAIDGFVQTVIFAWREKPWRVSKSKVHVVELNPIIPNNSHVHETRGEEVSVRRRSQKNGSLVLIPGEIDNSQDSSDHSMVDFLSILNHGGLE